MSEVLYNNLNATCPKVISNNSLTIELKEHQKTSIYAMLEFERLGKVNFTREAYIKNYNIFDKEYDYRISYSNQYLPNPYKPMFFEIESNYGILADKVGSGKTFIIMALLCYNITPNDREKIISSSIFSVMRYKDMHKAIKTNLIIVPHNLIIQWKETFNNCLLQKYIIMKNTDIDITDVSIYDVVIVSATMFDRFYQNNRDTKWSRIIIDEIVSIKLPPDMDFKCNFIWFITATPTGIKYIKRNYIRNLVSSMNIYSINNIIIKNNDDYVDESMKLPSINQIIIKCLTPKELKIIRGYVDSDIINMINAGNIHEAVLKLNCNIDTSEHILEVITKKIKKDIHNKKIELEYEERRIPDDRRLHEEKIKKIKDKINSLEIQFNSIEEKIKTFKEESCPICYDDLIQPMLISCCNNLFCMKCITMCSKCPFCRMNLDITKGIVISDEKYDIKKINNLCSKVDNLITLLKKKPKGKFLLFSNYDRTFDNINQKLIDNNIIFSRLIGTSAAINNTIRKFESGEIKVLLLNASNYGSGLNLQMATDIVIYHELELELETQVIGRAQRLGRTQPLNVYYLQNDNEKINCNNTALNLDIFQDDTTMLDNFVNESFSDSNSSETVQRRKYRGKNS
jgi:hypothetical protein